jgi:hypothetical protein
MPRKTPIRHTVSQYTRKGHPVRSYARGNGSRVVKQKKLATRYLKPHFDAEYIGTIGDIQDDPKYKDYDLTQIDTDTEAIWEHFGNDPVVKDFDGFFVKQKDGDYVDILGFQGTVPELHKALYRIVSK